MTTTATEPIPFEARLLIGRQVTRDLIAERAATIVDEENRTIEMAIFSDEPCLEIIQVGRSWIIAYIILDQKPGAINLQRFNAGAPLTENHDMDRRLGRIQKNTGKTDGRVFRAVARFSSRPYADEIFREVQEDLKHGDLPNVSGIAQVNEVDEKPERYIDNIPVIRATKWTPVEASIVSAGKDIAKTGVGRSLQLSPDPDTDQNLDAPPAQPPPTTRSVTMPEPIIPNPTPVVPPVSPLVAMATRSEEYVTFAAGFGADEGQKATLTELAREYALTGKTEPELFAAIQAKRSEFATKVPLSAPLSLTEKEQKEYSIGRAILISAGMKPGGEDLPVKDTNSFELEISRSLEKSCPRVANAPIGDFRMPTNVPLRGLDRKTVLQRAGLDTATATKGAELVYTEAGDSFIDLLRNAAMCLRLGATTLTGLQGDVEFSGQTAPGTVTWVGENPGADVAESDLSVDRPVKLSPKIAQSSTSYSRKLLAQSLYNVDNLVQNDLVLINSLEVDRVAVHGSGSAFQPKGIYQQTGVNAVAMGGVPTFDKLVDMETAIHAANAAIGALAYLTTPEIRGKCKKTPQLDNTIALPIWHNDEINGYRAEATNQISKVMNGSAAIGGASHGIVFGVWPFLLFGEWGALEIITDPYRLKKQGMVEITSYLMVDIALRYVASFSKGTGLTVS